MEPFEHAEIPTEHAAENVSRSRDLGMLENSRCRSTDEEVDADGRAHAEAQQLLLSTRSGEDDDDPLLLSSTNAAERNQFLHDEGAHDAAARSASQESEESLPRPHTVQISLRGLYISHFLSTWNARTYEFAAVIFTVEAFPNTLLPASISGIAQCITSILLSPSVGSWADRNPSRLDALKTTIIAQRLAVLSACAFWTFLLWSPEDPQTSGLRWSVLAAIVALSCVERLAAGGNVAVMERDWVPTLAPAVGESSLHELNATMRRIDLICKVLAPGFVTLLPSGFSLIEATKRHNVFWSVIVIASMSLVSPWVEFISAQQVWSCHRLLQSPKMCSERDVNSAPDGNRVGRTTGTGYLLDKFSGLLRFCRSAVFLPTVSIALMYLSVLTFSSPMITFLLNYGFSLPVVTIARLFSSSLEVSATAVMPWGVKKIRNRPAKYHRPINEEEFGFLEEELPLPSNIDKAEVERVGLWAVWWMTFTLMPAIYGVAGLTASKPLEASGLPLPYFSIPMLLGVAFSRVGLWTYDLAYSQLQQNLPPPTLRGEFTGIEQSFIATAELLQWTLTAVFSNPERFDVLASVSWLAVLGAAACYAWFIRQRRGHLLHVKVSQCCKN